MTLDQQPLRRRMSVSGGDAIKYSAGTRIAAVEQHWRKYLGGISYNNVTTYNILHSLYFTLIHSTLYSLIL
jgi:hypothetical protein